MEKGLIFLVGFVDFCEVSHDALDIKLDSDVLIVSWDRNVMKLYPNSLVALEAPELLQKAYAEYANKSKWKIVDDFTLFNSGIVTCVARW